MLFQQLVLLLLRVLFLVVVVHYYMLRKNWMHWNLQEMKFWVLILFVKHLKLLSAWLACDRACHRVTILSEDPERTGHGPSTSRGVSSFLHSRVFTRLHDNG